LHDISQMPSSRKAGVAVIGELFADEIFAEFGALPKLGEECFARKFKREVGGGAAITACSLAKLGVHVRVLGIVGSADGSWVVDRLASFGIDCSGLEVESDEPTGVTVSASTHEDRAFLTYYGANTHLAALRRREDTARTLASCRHVHFACAPETDTDSELLATLRRRHSTISIDVQSHVSWLTRPESVNILRQCDIFFPNEMEGAWVSSEVAPENILFRLKEKGLRGVGLKLGGKGAALLWKGRQFLSDPFPVKSLDTTGAGDCFDAGFIFGLLQGYSPQRCLQVANICGALSTRDLGGVAASPTLEELSECERQLENAK
jgi:sugar/nucleoside kinase (ribokinase family)